VTFRTASYPGAIADEIVEGVHYRRRGGHYTVYLRALLSQLVGRQRADVVVDVQNGVPFLSPLVTRTPVVNLVHHVHREQWKVIFGPRAARVGWWVESTLAPRIYRACRYVAVSPSTRSELAGLGVAAERITVIHNGTEPAPEQDTARSTTPLVSVLGRLVPHKRVEIAMDAVAGLADEFPDLRLTIAGSGWWGPHLEEYAARLGITDRVTFTGHVSELEKHQILAESWVLALPSVKEGWGLVVVEAGVHGTPTVAFRAAGGLKDSIQHDETGLLVDDGTEAFRRALAAVLGDVGLRARLSQGVVGWVEQLHWPETVSQWDALLVQLARAPQQRRA
jgi:glycosyltransferase involved in cell wall biosynthesis